MRRVFVPVEELEDLVERFFLFERDAGFGLEVRGREPAAHLEDHPRAFVGDAPRASPCGLPRLELVDELLERVRREDLSENLFAVRQTAQHVRHVERELVDRDLAFASCAVLRSLSVASPARKILLP